MEAFIFIGIIIVAIVAEALSVQMVSIWFAFGGVGGLIAYMAGADLVLQIAVFLVTTALCLVLSRPLAKRIKAEKDVRTNADRLIGAHGTVTDDIVPDEMSGRVHIGGNSWSAVSLDNTAIKKDTKVSVKKIEGAKLIVEQID